MAILQSQRRLLAVVFLHAVGKPETRPPGTWEKARQGDPTQAAKTRPHPRLEITVDCTLIINLPLRIIHIIHSGKRLCLILGFVTLLRTPKGIMTPSAAERSFAGPLWKMAIEQLGRLGIILRYC
jgi:hypothetical protein